MSKLTKASFIVFCLFTCDAIASVPVSVNVNANQITLDQTLNVNFVFNEVGIDNFNFPRSTVEYNTVASSSSSNIKVINGQVSQNKTLSFVVKPISVGTMTIPAVSYTFNNQAYQTQPVQVSVVESAQNPNTISQRQNTIKSSAIPSTEEQDLMPFVENLVSNKNPYVNQQFLIKTKIYHRGNVRNLNLSMMKIDHLNLKRIEQAKEYTEERNGIEYMVYEIDYTAFPLKSGPITVPEYDVNALVITQRPGTRGRRIDPFSLMTGFFQEQKLLLKAPALTINVQALPENAPNGFSGYVGTLAVNHQVDRLNINSGDAITIKTNVYGNGNSKNLKFDFIEDSKLYTVYKDSENINTEINNDFEYFGLNASAAVIPDKKSGRIKIKTKPLVNFNPYTRRFEQHGLEEFEVFVKPSIGANTNEQENGVALANQEIPPQQQQFVKELSIFAINEIQEFKKWKIFDSNYLIIILFSLNLAYFTRFTMRRVKFGKNNETIDLKMHLNRIKNATALEEISSIVKEIEKEVELDAELKIKFDNFTKITDSYNYGFKQNYELAELKSNAVDLIKEYKAYAAKA